MQEKHTGLSSSYFTVKLGNPALPRNPNVQTNLKTFP